ncbi:hypothetical protein NL676_021897 [Syzygium grande]|nr:hypothetical protein NL676_021897 [Syzygium grande]
MSLWILFTLERTACPRMLSKGDEWGATGDGLNFDNLLGACCPNKEANDCDMVDAAYASPSWLSKCCSPHPGVISNSDLKRLLARNIDLATGQIHFGFSAVWQSASVTLIIYEVMTVCGHQMMGLHLHSAVSVGC